MQMESSMNSPPPIKPPRREKWEKYSKETTGCGLLVSVIKTLDASETNEQRQKEKLKIEKEFKKSDQLLNELVSKHDGDLTKVMQLFGKVSTHVTMSREKIHTVKENLHACKQLLRCRREELKKLWMDAVQQKYVLEMFDQINELRKVPSIVTAYTTKRQYLHATKALTSAIAVGEGALKEVEGLNELRHDLEMRKNQLYSKLLEELAKHLYHTNTADFLTSFQRQGSARNSSYAASPFQRNVLRKSAERAESNTKVRRALFEMQQGAFDVDKTEILEDGEVVDVDLNSTYFIGIITECFALLDKVPESLETIQVQMQCELGAIVARTTQHIITLGPPPLVLDGQNAPPHPLIELLDLLYKQFKIVADTHILLLKNYSNVIQRYKISGKSYDIVDYWSQAQIVLENLLGDYLNIDSPSSEEQPRSTFIEQTTNLNTFFSRRKIPHKKTLFKFDKSSHTVSEGDAKEHRRNLSDMSYDDNITFDPTHTSTDKKKRERQLVCSPDLALIRTIYLPLMNYIFEIEGIAKSGQKCSLHTFLAQHVKETFLARGHNRSLQNTIESLSKTQDAWKAIVSLDEVKRLGLNRPLLQSTVLVESRIRETTNLIQDLPNYSEDLLKMICALLKTYRETCQAAYRGIVQPETEDKRIYSVAWLKDDDISRFLKTLPNWTDLKMSHMRRQQFGKATNHYEMSEEESMVQVQQRNIREAEMLTSNLCEGGISQYEILSDVGVLKELAILQQSMEWFSGRISEFASNLRKPIVNGMVVSNELITPVVVQDGTIKVLTNLALEFDELANTCLLVLHLEVRVQCFHYLRSYPSDRTRAGDFHKGDNLEPDSKVLKLTKVLSDMDEAFSSTLHPRKVKYIFEGLAHLAARILIMASNSMESIDQMSVQRMCRNAQALQQTLSSITATREVALDHARNFYEMLYMKPEEILAQIVEKGAQFTEMQYLNALQLICKNRGVTDQNMLATYQQKLSDLLGPKPPLGVTV